MKANQKATLHGSDFLLMTVIYLSVILLTLSIIQPFILIFFQSVTPLSAMNRNSFSFFPRTWDFSAYEYLLFHSGLVVNGLKNSAFLVIVGTLFSLVLTTTAAYTLSKKYLPYRRLLTYFIYIPMLFSGGLIPTFLIVKFTGQIYT